MPKPVPLDDALIRLAFDLSPSGILVVDGGGLIVAVNREAEQQFGWSKDELIGRSIEELVPERFRGKHPGFRSAFMGNAHARPMGAGRDLYGLRRDGTEFPVEIGLNPVTSEQGMFVLASVVDISTRRKLEEHLDTAHQRDIQRLIHADGFIGQSPQIREMLQMLTRVAETDSTVLIRGESGVGKELVARAVHRQSRRSRQPFVVVDCASLHENLLQSELFGHEKGAYTGAVRLKHGLFEVADRGTIFLDEIGEITPPLQVKLLRVLETGTFRRVGGTTDIQVDVRVIAATNRALETMMKEKGFREDLYYRLNVFSLSIPPLRERKEDIPLLVEHFIRNSAVAPKRNVKPSATAMQVLTRYLWPGNVRELENVIERALILCDAGSIEPEHLPLGVRLEPSFRPTEEDGSLVTLEEVERRYVKRVLEECKGHRQKAASILGISERNLYRKLKDLES
ncbi:MAG TPA: sigma 54-interacting transcriptional regulator [Candidatus Eisenbacteria bacterium]|nr:sigma 54-interacting transcriptional regulator [Candidatus Eisenbacteria bacterium]